VVEESDVSRPGVGPTAIRAGVNSQVVGLVMTAEAAELENVFAARRAEEYLPKVERERDVAGGIRPIRQEHAAAGELIRVEAQCGMKGSIQGVREATRELVVERASPSGQGRIGRVER
jgi:hypothetical protein